MALIPCPKCGKEISSAAVACPHCGYRPGIDPLPTAYRPQDATNAQATVQPSAPVLSDDAVNLKEFEDALDDIVSDDVQKTPSLTLESESTEPKVRVYVNGVNEEDAAPARPASNAPTENIQRTAPVQSFAPQSSQNEPNTQFAPGNASREPAMNAGAYNANQAYSPAAQPAQSYTPPYNNGHTPQKQKKKKSIPAVIIAIVVLAVLAVYYMVPTTYNNLNQQGSYIKLTRLGNKFEQQMGSGSDIEILNGTYVLNAPNLKLSDSDGYDTDYIIDGKYVISNQYEIYSGSPNVSSNFDCTVTKEYNYTNSSGVETYILFMYLFKSDGSCSYGVAIYYNNVKNYTSTSFGKYTINGGVINIIYDSGDQSGDTDCLYVYNSTLYSTVYSK